MVYRIGAAHGCELERGQVQDFLAAAGVSLTGQYLEQIGRRVVGGLLGAAAGNLVLNGGTATLSGGLVVGGLIAISMSGFGWRWRVGSFLIPTIIYGFMMLRQRFPVQERVAAGVSYSEMLKEFGWASCFIVSMFVCYAINEIFLVFHQHFLLLDHEFLSAAIYSLFPTFVFAFKLKSFGRPMFVFLLFVMVLLPLWASYLVRIYAWRTMLAHDGAINWALNGLGLPDQNIADTNWAMWIVFSYVWLPFMILPVFGALERLPHSLIEASRDLGAGGFQTFRRVVLPLALPGVVAGSIFTFSLTLGDYVTPLLAGGHPGTQFIGPGAMMQVAFRHFDPHDEGDRIEQAVFSGLWDCVTCGRCDKVCPSEIPLNKILRTLKSEAETRGLKPDAKTAVLSNKR